MTADLVQVLRTCSAEERGSVAMRLAKTGTDEAVAELIRMVEGRRRHWLSWYNLNDQLIGVESLGETGNPRALDYLKLVYIAKETVHRTVGLIYPSSFLNYEETYGEEAYGETITTTYSYPLIRGGLSDRVEYWESVSDVYASDTPERTMQRDERVHNLFNSAIGKLIESLKQKRSA